MLPTYVVYIVAAVVAVVAGLLGFLFAKNREKKNAEGIIAAAKQQKKNILEEAKKVENEKKESRKKEVEDAYDNFVTLLEAYEKDFGGGYKVSLVGNFSL